MKRIDNEFQVSRAVTQLEIYDALLMKVRKRTLKIYFYKILLEINELKIKNIVKLGFTILIRSWCILKINKFG